MSSSSDIHKADILIVDDQATNIALLEEMLRGAGYVSITSTMNPHEVCELHRKNHYDLILLDLLMPSMDGFQVMEGLKQVETGSYLPVLVITAQPEHRLRALKTGARDFISKPFALAEVLIRVYNMLEIRLLHVHESLNLVRLENSQRIASLGDWEYDYASHRLVWSEEVYRILGVPRKDTSPESESFYRRVYPDDLAFVHQEKKAIAAGLRRVDFEHRIIRPNGEVRHIHQIAELVHDAEGQPVRESGTIQDITEKKKLEAQLLRAQRMESIGTLAGGIAHDLNNVLAPIMMSIELLKLDPANDPQRSRILDIIQVSSRRGADLVRQVLSFSLGFGDKRVAIRLRQLIDDLEGIISGTFPSNIRIISTVPIDLWPIIGDPSQLHQVLLNLAINARDAMPHGGTLTLAAANLVIDAQFAGTSPKAKAGSYVLLQVTDTGLGIPPEVRERIFEPFFTTKETGKGTGLGLATVHTVVKSHGGFLNVESDVGRGTTFKIYLPADPAHLPSATLPPFPVDLPRGLGELVLVVDDEFSIRHITQKTLEAFGYRVLTANDGAEAVAHYAKQAPQIALVITDMMMPVMDGAATIQVLLRINPALRIILASGIDSGDNVAKARSAGVKDFLPKPYTAETLLKLVREVLDRPAPPQAAPPTTPDKSLGIAGRSA